MTEADKIELMCRKLAGYLVSKGENREAFTAEFIADQIKAKVHFGCDDNGVSRCSVEHPNP